MLQEATLFFLNGGGEVAGMQARDEGRRRQGREGGRLEEKRQGFVFAEEMLYA
jgi:hypothetical protein